MAICRGSRTRFIVLLPLIILPLLLLPVFELHQKPNQKAQKTNFPKKSDQLVLGPSAGQGLPNRLQCQGKQLHSTLSLDLEAFTCIKAMNMNKIRPSSLQNDLGKMQNVSFVSMFTVYNGSHRMEQGSIKENMDSNVIVGNTSYNKVERSIAILKTFINFIQKQVTHKKKHLSVIEVDDDHARNSSSPSISRSEINGHFYSLEAKISAR
ncbi:hypothetical protein KSP40_PGU016744 [Platanthera guangdongensis]|uniref:Uncharacterized protein n=1 Tax=Platanthera guangdongensis TaxID=2320717 RepID=A0ABR2M166_9ASPA